MKPFTAASNELPIHAYKEHILEAIATHQVTIITAETGAGKSTQVPQYLAEGGFTKVVVTQPRIIAARNLSSRVREEWQATHPGAFPDVVAYRTAHERDDTQETHILYCTDGLQLVREITGVGVGSRQVLVLDEVHEWNENMEVLIAWAKKRCSEDRQFKVVIMSATIESDTLAAYFGGAAIISVPGRSFPVEKRLGAHLMDEVLLQLEQGGKNILVFLPGKAEIQEMTEFLQGGSKNLGIPILPLHSQLEAIDQQKAFAHYPRGKVVLSTNIAQTSVTIDDIDVVIDSGLERRSEVKNGVEGLFIAQISQADALQRAGRAGRTREGLYVLAPYGSMPCLPLEERPAYGTPEILRKHIDRLTLRLANIGIDIEELEFFHDPSRRSIAQAKRTLVALGALTKGGAVTSIGRSMERFPVESSYGRMLVEAQTCSLAVQTKLAAIIGIQEVGGVVRGGTRYGGWQKYVRQHRSDFVAQYEVFLTLPSIDEVEYEELGVIAKNVDKAEEVMERLLHDLGLEKSLLGALSTDETESILRCIVAGQIDQLWSIDDSGVASHVQTKAHREISSSSIVRGAHLVTGTPFDLQIPTRDGSIETLHLVQGLTAVKAEWVIAFAPSSFAPRRGKLFYNPHSMTLEMRNVIRFQGRVIEADSIAVDQNTPANRREFTNALSHWLYTRLEAERNSLEIQTGRRVPTVSLKQVQRELQPHTGEVISLLSLPDTDQKRIMKLGRLEYYLGEDFMQRLSMARRHHQLRQRRTHGWRGRSGQHEKRHRYR